MNAEDIIQQKEWQALLQEEKSVIIELATTEDEFNLLKQMLAVSADMENAVPELKSSIKTNIDDSIYPTHKKQSTYWWYAAAAIALVLFAITFLMFPANENGSLVANSPILPEMKLPPQKKAGVNDAANIVAKETIAVKRVIKLRKKMLNKPDFNMDNSFDLAVHISVGDNEELLAFVTEVY